jgi:CheY-like chemotaxis protein
MIKVLIAEDNAVNRELLRELLELRGYTVLEACDCQEALDIIEQAQPEIPLLDIGMPDKGGFRDPFLRLP